MLNRLRPLFTIVVNILFTETLLKKVSFAINKKNIKKSLKCPLVYKMPRELKYLQ